MADRKSLFSNHVFYDDSIARGLWVSFYGFESWLEYCLSSLGQTLSIWNPSMLKDTESRNVRMSLEFDKEFSTSSHCFSQSNILADNMVVG